MAKIALLGDIHLGARNDSQIVMAHQFKFFEDVFFPYLDKHKIKFVIQMGDTFDRRKYTNHALLHQWRNRVFDRLNAGYQSYFVVGNHDISYRNTVEVNSPSLFLHDYDNIRIFPKVSEVNVDGTDILMVPWICSENETEILNMVKSTKAHFCAGHFEFGSFPMQKGHMIEDGLDKKLFNKFDKVFSGHYHTKSNDGRIFYLGTPIELTWIDHDDPKGFWVFDTTTHDLEFIKNPYSLFNKVYYDDKGKKKDKVSKFDASLFKDTYVKVVVVNKTDAYMFDSFINKFYQVGVADLKVIEDLQADVDEVEIDDQIELEDTSSLIESFCDQLETTLNKDKFKSLVKGLYVESLSIIE